MACPMRFVLAAVSAFVALFIIWRRKEEVDPRDSDGHSGAKRRPLASGEQTGWGSLILSFFTGRFLWDVYTGKGVHVERLKVGY